MVISYHQSKKQPVFDRIGKINQDLKVVPTLCDHWAKITEGGDKVFCCIIKGGQNFVWVSQWGGQNLL